VTTPAGYHTITPRMIVADTRAAVDFLRAVFDAQGEVTEGRPAEIRIGDSLVLVSTAGERERFPALLYIYVADADATHARAIAAGAVSIEAPLNTRTATAAPWSATHSATSTKSPQGPPPQRFRSREHSDTMVLEL
jgi:uncharacterized glyoxalase superfamily protein PhnB